MRVLVTGSSGTLGRATVSRLMEAGHEVVGIDLTPHPEQACPTLVDNLLDRFAIHRAFARFPGAAPDAIVHAANHIHANVAPRSVVYCENNQLNHNVFAAALDVGVSRIVFISSVQAMIGGTLPDGSPNLSPPHELPISEAIPCRPTNVYALSKRQAEFTLEELTNPLGFHAQLRAVSLRLPYILNEDGFQRNLGLEGPVDFRWGGSEVFAYIHVCDAAEAVLLSLENNARGHEAFWCAAPDPRTPESVRELIDLYYTSVPGADRAAELDSFNDCSKASERLGWTPLRTLRAARLGQHEAR